MRIGLQFICEPIFLCCNEPCTDEHNMTVGRLLTYRHIYAKIYRLNVATPSNSLRGCLYGSIATRIFNFAHIIMTNTPRHWYNELVDKQI